MADTIVTDVALTWIAAVGCALYWWMLRRAGKRGGAPQRFLIGVLACLLTVRGFDWLFGVDALDRATLVFAALLPLAVTLFAERVLRRHHPLWFKLVSLAATLALLFGSLLTPLLHDVRFVLAFACCSAFVVFVNGIFLLIRRRASLSQGENALADVLLLLAPISVGLVLTDFHLLAAVTPLRLGSIAALLLVYSMLGTAVESVRAATWAWRCVSLLGAALVLAVVIAQAVPGATGVVAWPRIERAWPVAYAWILLTAVVVKRNELSADRAATDFMQWLARAPLRTATAFVADLKAQAGAHTHVSLGAQDLREYSVATLQRLCSAEHPVVSLDRARQVQRAPGDLLADAAEQWIDLLERTEMTHGFIVSHEPAQALLLNVPASALPDRVERQLRVTAHICQQLDERDQQSQGQP